MKFILAVILILNSAVALGADASTDAASGAAPSPGAINFGNYSSPDSLLSLYQPFLTNMGPYQPIYFLLGVDPEDSRFQLSFKYQLFGDDCPAATACNWITGIHLGYTQTSSWDLESDSAPFEDTSYKPEIFYLSKNVSLRPRWMNALFYEVGLQHESNGRDDVGSRSTNYFYVSPMGIVYSSAQQTGLLIAPKFVYFFNNSDDTNPDIEDYRGHFELELKTGTAQGIIFGSTLHFASEGTSLQLDMTYPLSMFFFKNLEFYVHAQYVDTLAETLLNYKERTEAFRIGFSLVR